MKKYKRKNIYITKDKEKIILKRKIEVDKSFSAFVIDAAIDKINQHETNSKTTS